MPHEGVDAFCGWNPTLLVADAGKTLGIQDSPRIDGAENLMFLNVPKFNLQDLFYIHYFTTNCGLPLFYTNTFLVSSHRYAEKKAETTTTRLYESTNWKGKISSSKKDS